MRSILSTHPMSNSFLFFRHLRRVQLSRSTRSNWDCGEWNFASLSCSSRSTDSSMWYMCKSRSVWHDATVNAIDSRRENTENRKSKRWNVMIGNIHLNRHGDECNVAVWWLLSGIVPFGRRIHTENERVFKYSEHFIKGTAIYLAASRSFIDKFVVDSSALIALLLLWFKWLLWAVLLLLLLWLLPPSLPLWWCEIAFSVELWPTDVVIDDMFKSVMRSTVFSDSYVTARNELNEMKKKKENIF